MVATLNVRREEIISDGERRYLLATSDGECRGFRMAPTRPPDSLVALPRSPQPDSWGRSKNGKGCCGQSRLAFKIQGTLEVSDSSEHYPAGGVVSEHGSACYCSPAPTTRSWSAIWRRSAVARASRSNLVTTTTSPSRCVESATNPAPTSNQG